MHLPSSPRLSKASASSSGVGAGGCGRIALCRKGVVSAALHVRDEERGSKHASTKSASHIDISNTLHPKSWYVLLTWVYP